MKQIAEIISEFIFVELILDDWDVLGKCCMNAFFYGVVVVFFEECFIRKDGFYGDVWKGWSFLLVLVDKFMIFLDENIF